jgi:hypothetical protein
MVSQKLQAKTNARVAAALPSGEEVVIAVPASAPVALGLIGGVVGAVLAKRYYLVLTGAAVVVLSARKPCQIVASSPRGATLIASVVPGKVTSSVYLTLPGKDKPVTLLVDAQWQAEVDRLAAFKAPAPEDAQQAASD